LAQSSVHFLDIVVPDVKTWGEEGMKLYCSPSACSLTPHIFLVESALGLDIEKVDLATKNTEHGADYWKINPKGHVPTFEMDNCLLFSVRTLSINK
jgi:hypothetical protein